MPRMRAADRFWKIGDSVNAASTSGYGNVGQQTNMALFVRSDKACTFKIQVTGETLASGRNADLAGADWYDWHRSADADAVETITVSAGGAIAVDLSPFAPQY